MAMLKNCWKKRGSELMETPDPIQLKEITDCFCSLVRIDSPGGSEEAMRIRLCELLEPLAGKGETDAAGNLKFTLPGTRPGPVCLFCSHMDTVEPGRGIVPRLDSDGRIRSDTSTILGADDKDGITALIFALRKLHEGNIPHGPLEILFTAGMDRVIRLMNRRMNIFCGRRKRFSPRPECHRRSKIFPPDAMPIIWPVWELKSVCWPWGGPTIIPGPNPPVRNISCP